MIEVKIPREINSYKEKLFFNLTLRQTICTVVAIGVNVPLYFFGKNYINADLLSWIVIIIAIPIMFAGYFKYNNLNFEEFITVVLKYNLFSPQIRIYRTKNLYEYLNRNGGKK